jgi:hypothetical protein
MPLKAARATKGLGQERLSLNATAIQFGFNSVKDDLGRHYGKIGPEDGHSARGD